MTTSTKAEFPHYAKLSLILIGLAALFAILYVGRPIFVPLIGATLVAIMFSPVVDFLMRKRIHKLIAISITLLLGIIVISAMGFLVASQVSGFKEMIPQIKTNFGSLLNDVKGWASSSFGLSPQKFDSMFNVKKMLSSGTPEMGKTLLSLGNIVMLAVVLPVYIFLILYYKPLLVEFIHRLCGYDNEEVVADVLATTKITIKSYLSGLLLEALIVGTLYSIGLLIIGVKFALLLGVIAALLNIIPYVGQIVAGSLSVLMALATKESPTYALITLGLFAFIQVIDNNFILPRVVASKVKLNALVSIVVVIAGNLMWGVPGMFLAIPLTAICKVIFDDIKGLKAWGFLLGASMPGVKLMKEQKNPRKDE
ncbi:MAG: AI-2E family transporter [Bacteroidota bacterium]|nr:AI-2E family transporter [Bacteroidota bacterium]